jgi:ElaB/YqjD/DUF883 family membrane-anchored ribosome-binding protein
MGQSSDQIRQEIDQNRNSAAEKIDQLKDQVQGTADNVRGQVQDTAEQVVDQVKGTVDQTVESVKQNVQNMDFKQQIEERPLVALGAALLGGFLLGGMMGGGGQHGQGGSSRQEFSSGTPVGASQSGGGVASGIRSAVQRSGLEDTISNAAAALMGSVTEQLKGTLDQSFPGFAGKMNTAQESGGSFSEKTKVTTST